MPISKRGEYYGSGQWPFKSAYNFERFDSHLEEMMMVKLDSDPTVTKWMKRHGISIPWVDTQKHMRRYVPDFLIEYNDGRKALVEVKDPSRWLDSDEVKRKRKAAEIWCKRRGMEYVVATI